MAGIDGARADLEEIADFLRNPERDRWLGAATPRGVLLHGPPGTGKTLLARAVAGEADVPFLSLSASEFVEMYVGVGASRVRDLFAQAKAVAPRSSSSTSSTPSVARAPPGRATGGATSGSRRSTRSSRSSTAFTGFEGIIVLAATDRPEILDPAFLRAGRFDRRISVNPPDRVGREAILRVHTRGHPLAPDVDLGALPAVAIGMVGADLRNHCRRGCPRGQLPPLRSPLPARLHRCSRQAHARRRAAAGHPAAGGRADRPSRGGTRPPGDDPPRRRPGAEDLDRAPRPARRGCRVGDQRPRSIVRTPVAPEEGFHIIALVGSLGALDAASTFLRGRPRRPPPDARRRVP